MKSSCIICGRDATRFHCHHLSGVLEDLCELHYAQRGEIGFANWSIIRRMRLTEDERHLADKLWGELYG